MDIIILGTVLGFLAALVNTAVMIGSILNLRQKEEKPLQETTQPTEKKLVEQIRESVNALEVFIGA